MSPIDEIESHSQPKFNVSPPHETVFSIALLCISILLFNFDLYGSVKTCPYHERAITDIRWASAPLEGGVGEDDGAVQTGTYVWLFLNFVPFSIS